MNVPDEKIQEFIQQITELKQLAQGRVEEDWFKQYNMGRVIALTDALYLFSQLFQNKEDE